MSKKQVRNLESTLEIRSENDSKVIEGYAIKYNVHSQDLGGYTEIISPEAFSKSLSNDIRALFNHSTENILGRTSNNTLTLENRSDGLYFRLELPNTTLGNDLYELISRGDITGVSFGFYILKDEVTRDNNKTVVTIREGELLEISPVTFPAYSQSFVVSRSLDEITKPSEKATPKSLNDNRNAYRLRFGKDN